MEYNKIVITTDGVTTKADEYIGKKLVKSALSKCSPDDTYDFPTGAKLAFERLMKPDKPTYKAGDRAVIIGNSNRHCYQIGDVVTLESSIGKEHWSTGMWQGVVKESDISPYTEPAQPDKGEAVKLYCIKDNWDWLKRGKVYEIGTDGIFTGEKALTMFKYKSVEELFSGNHSWRDCLIPLIKRPAKVGEWVYVVDAKDTGNNYKNGDILQIIEWEKIGTHCNHYKREIGKFLYDSEYLVLDGYQPEPEKKYWSGKAVCKENKPGITKGHTYEFKNGFTTDNEGRTIPVSSGELPFGPNNIESPDDPWFDARFVALID